MTYLLVRNLAFHLLFWLGSATGHGPHTPTTTPFQYRGWFCIEEGPTGAGLASKGEDLGRLAMDDRIWIVW